MGKRLIALTCAAAFFAGAVFSQMAVNQARTSDRGEDILFLPNRKLLNHFTGGLNNVVADLLWIRCIQYIAEETKGERSFKWLNQMLNTVVQLDPYFGDAYRHGGMFLAALKADDDAGIDLLERGVIMNPNNYQIPYELAMIFLLNRKDEPGAKERATYYLSMAASIEGCPPFILDLATKLQGRYDLEEVEADMWRRMAESDDKLLRELGERKLVLMEIRKATEQLNDAVIAFNRRNGRFPSSLEELAGAGIVPVPLNDPLGGSFLLGEDGVIRNSTLLDEEKENRLKILRNVLNRYQDREGNWPPDLQALVDADLVPRIPNHPYPGAAWQYDPRTGAVK